MKKKKPIIGWREWVALPDLAVPAIKAKVDTGARTSALHAIHISPFFENGKSMVSFEIHPLQRDGHTQRRCVAPVLDYRLVTNSGGQREQRYVIVTSLVLGGQTFHIEVSLTDRVEMGFRMLLGREALRKRFLVNPGRSFITGRLETDKLIALYHD